MSYGVYTLLLAYYFLKVLRWQQNISRNNKKQPFLAPLGAKLMNCVMVNAGLITRNADNVTYRRIRRFPASFQPIFNPDGVLLCFHPNQVLFHLLLV